LQIFEKDTIMSANALARVNHLGDWQKEKLNGGETGELEANVQFADLKEQIEELKNFRNLEKKKPAVTMR
jgi:hypothetical protein